MTKPRISKETFLGLAERAGLRLTAQQQKELHEAYGHVEAMAERLRAGGKRSPEAEPAVIFKAKA